MLPIILSMAEGGFIFVFGLGVGLSGPYYKPEIRIKNRKYKKHESSAVRSITLRLDQESAFDKMLDYFQESDLFIQSLDKQAGFIQARVFVKHRKIFSAKDGERRTLNFILQPAADGQTEITLSIYSETRYFGGDISARTYYYEDTGVLDDPVVYEEYLNDLRQAIEG